MNAIYWISDNYIEIAGALTGIIYVFLEIRQSIWLWPFGIVTSALYILVFFTSKFYADAGLQVYYLVISVFGWYWWARGRSVERRAESVKPGTKGLELTETDPLPGGARGGLKEESVERKAESGEEGRSTGHRAQSTGEKEKRELPVTKLLLKTGIILSGVFAALFALMWYILDNFTDSPVPGWDSFLTALSIIATWMLARKILEHWILWIVVDIVSMFVYMLKGLYPTVVLFGVYSAMAFVGYFEWRRGLRV